MAGACTGGSARLRLRVTVPVDELAEYKRHPVAPQAFPSPPFDHSAFQPAFTSASTELTLSTTA